MKRGRTLLRVPYAWANPRDFNFDKFMGDAMLTPVEVISQKHVLSACSYKLDQDTQDYDEHIFIFLSWLIGLLARLDIISVNFW